MSDWEMTPVIRIHPEPSPEELVAIVAALTAALRQRQPAQLQHQLEPSRWSRQGRLEAMRGRDAIGADGWGES